MTTSQQKKENHALNNAIGHIKSMVEYFETGSYIESCNPTSQEQEEKDKVEGDVNSEENTSEDV